jgi:hypothetical protein
MGVAESFQMRTVYAIGDLQDAWVRAWTELFERDVPLNGRPSSRPGGPDLKIGQDVFA